MKKLFLIALVSLACMYSRASEDFFEWRNRAVLLTEYFAPLDVTQTPFFATGKGLVDDAPAIQAAIDSAVKTFRRVIIPAGKYRLDKTLVVARWSDITNAYLQSFIRIEGDDAMHSPGITMLQPTFKNAPVLALHLNKGSIISGLFFDGKYKSPAISLDSFFRTPMDKYGDTLCRDSQYSPFCAIAIDPFRGFLPPDSGYPTLRAWYRGADVVSGSTGIRISDCTFRNVTIGLIMSPNGKTLNNEIFTAEHIRVNDCKYAFVGCQAQEKGNVLYDWEIWGRVKCAFVWAKYGQGQPGQYEINKVNIAGQVAQVVHRPSQSYFPLTMKNIYAESIYTIGYWNTTMSDVCENSSFNFYYYKYVNGFPNSHFEGNGVRFENVQARYYGVYNVPVLFKGSRIQFSNSEQSNYVHHVKGWRVTDTYAQNAGFQLDRISYGYFRPYFDGTNKKLIVKQKLIEPAVGDIVVFNQSSNYDFAGFGEVIAITDSNYTIGYLPPVIDSIMRWDIRKYKSIPYDTTGSAN